MQLIVFILLFDVNQSLTIEITNETITNIARPATTNLPLRHRIVGTIGVRRTSILIITAVNVCKYYTKDEEEDERETKQFELDIV